MMALIIEIYNQMKVNIRIVTLRRVVIFRENLTIRKKTLWISSTVDKKKKMFRDLLNSFQIILVLLKYRTADLFIFFFYFWIVFFKQIS